MKKSSLIYVFPAMLTASSALAAANEPSAVEKTLSAMYGAPVEVKIEGDSCKIKYPEVTIEKEALEYKESPTDKDEIIVETKTVTSTIPETIPTCQKTEKFLGREQYVITTNSPSKLLAQLYNLSSLSFLEDVEIKDFVEQTSIVPELGLVSADAISIKNASYTEKDPATGLKSEIGSLKELTYFMKTEQAGDTIKYRMDSKLDTFNLATPMFSVQINSEQQAASFKYEVTPDFDYSYGMLKNFDNLISSQSRALGKGIKVNMGFINAGFTFDLDMKSSVSINGEGSYDVVARTMLHNISFSGNLLDKSKQFKAIVAKYTLNNLNLESVAKLNKLQEKALEEDKKIDSAQYDAEFATVMDEILEKGAFKFEFKIAFPNAEISGSFDAARQKGYLVGEGIVSVKNLFSIFPEQEECVGNPMAREMEECQNPIFLSLQNIMDVSKNYSETTYKYNDKGVFKNGEKIGEPIEIDFHKMLEKQNELQSDIDEEDEEFDNMMKDNDDSELNLDDDE